ncbi:MAG: flagellar basal-body rod protein FlgF [bacterium]
MIKGLYTALFGMRPVMRRQDILSNNLANINTTGYKKSDLFVRSFIDFVENDEQKPFMNDNMKIDEVKIDFSPGPLVQTGGTLDLAIDGKGFFTVDTNDGVQYTRNGSFTISNDGEIVDLNGNRLLGEDGPLFIQGNRVTISPGGYVDVDGAIMGRVNVVDFQDPTKLEKVGACLFRNFGEELPQTVENIKLHQGYLETSNVNTVETMVKMMTAYRNFEADQRMIHALDETLEKAVNEVGRIR